jgi:hypothetical protein
MTKIQYIDKIPHYEENVKIDPISTKSGVLKTPGGINKPGSRRIRINDIINYVNKHGTEDEIIELINQILNKTVKDKPQDVCLIGDASLLGNKIKDFLENHAEINNRIKFVEIDPSKLKKNDTKKKDIKQPKNKTRKSASSDKSTKSQSIDKKQAAIKTTKIVEQNNNNITSVITQLKPTKPVGQSIPDKLMDLIPTIEINTPVNQSPPVRIISENCPLANNNVYIKKGYQDTKSKKGWQIKQPSNFLKQNKDEEESHKRVVDDSFIIEIFRILDTNNTLNERFFTKKDFDTLQKYKGNPKGYLKQYVEGTKFELYHKTKLVTDEYIDALQYTATHWNPLVKECETEVKNEPVKQGIVKMTIMKPKRKIKNDIVPSVEPKVIDKPVVDIEYKELMKIPLITSEDKYNDFLYPELDDHENFNKNLLQHREFNNNNKEVNTEEIDIAKKAEELCNAEFELMPHQMFVKNFLSTQTPYNGLLLFHGLGTGKTCSAIGISEEMRNYIKQIGAGSNRKSKKIIVVASPNVQSNFRLQLFDSSKLKQNGSGDWNIEACLGDALLKEINPTMVNKMTKENITDNIRRIIDKYYSFYGYTQFSNMVGSIVNYGGILKNNVFRDSYKIREIKKAFSDTLIIIDEAHNIRDTAEGGKDIRAIAGFLRNLADHADNLRLLLLTATPMFNKPDEIIWIINLLNANDKRSTIKTGDVFDKDGNLKEKKDGKESGMEIIKRKLTGYVSYVRGENPYTFPYRIYPKKDDYFKYPTKQMNGKTLPRLEDEKELLDNIPIQYIKMKSGGVQQKVYNEMMKELIEREFKFFRDGIETNMKGFEERDKFGYELMQPLIEALNMAYHYRETFTDGNRKEALHGMIGSKGLDSIMKYTETSKSKSNYEYKIEPTKEKPGIFTESVIHNHSAKISEICKMIKKSDGIIMVYSQYIDGGIIPLALALEEMGFSRRVSGKNKNLMKNRSVSSLDVDKMIPKNELNEDDSFNQASYVMLTGDERFSPDNEKDLAELNNIKNNEGRKIKVVLISRAAGEGVDFKNIRQVHIMEPWYNLSRLEQIIGRGVRNRSHCSLPFEKRNVEIFLYATQLDALDVESPDMYLYRWSAIKAHKIGKITRIMKENAIDCALKFGQTDFTGEQIEAFKKGTNNKIELSSKKREAGYKGETLTYETISDKPYSDICDYMDCNMKCNVSVQDMKTLNVHDATYTTKFAQNNTSAITKRIQDIFADLPKGLMFIDRTTLHDMVNVRKNYSEEEIDLALTTIIESRTVHITDTYGRSGRIINKTSFYYFQPDEVTDINASIYERSVKVREKLKGVSKEITYKPAIKEKQNILDNMKIKYDMCFPSTEYTCDDDIWGKTKQEGPLRWYYWFIYVKKHLIENEEIKEDTLKQYVIDHMIDGFTFLENIDLLNIIDIYEYTGTDPFYKCVKSHYDRIIADLPSSTDKKPRGALFVELDENKTEVNQQRQQNGSAMKYMKQVYLINKDDGKGWQYNGDSSGTIDDLYIDANKRNVMVSKRLSKRLSEYVIGVNNVIGVSWRAKKTETDYSTFKFRTVNSNEASMGALIKDMKEETKIIKLKDIPSKTEYVEGNGIYIDNCFANGDIKPESYRKNGGGDTTVHHGLDVIIEVLLRFNQDINGANKTYFMDAGEFFVYKKAKLIPP